MQTSGVAQVNSTHLYYETVGRGHPLVLIHGGFVGSKIWDNQLDAFAARYQVVRYDCRGYGQSARIETSFSAYMDLYALLGFLELDSPLLIGSSAGGALAIDFTIAYPGRVQALVLAGAALNGYAYSATLQQRNRGFLSAYHLAGASGLTQALLADPYFPPAPHYGTARDQLREMIEENAHIAGENWQLQQQLNPPAAQRLGEIQAPTLVLIGERDDADNQAAATFIADNIQNAQHVVVPAAGHLIQLEQPDAFNQIVLEYLHHL